MLIRYIDKIILVVVYAVLLLWISIIIWASNKGFNISDEGLYMYYFSLAEKSKSTINFTSFHVLQSSLFPFVKPTIQNLRLERLLLNSCVTLVLMKACIVFFQNEFKYFFSRLNKWLLGALIFSSISLSYMFGPQTISYNVFSSLLMVLALSFFLFDFSKKDNLKTASIYSFLLGLIISMLLVVKVSNALLLFFITLIIFIINDYFTSKSIRKTILFFLLRVCFISIGFIIFQLSIWEGFNGFVSFLEKTELAISFLSHHTVKGLIMRYVNGVPYLLEILFFKQYILLLITSISLLILQVKKQTEAMWLMLLLQIYIVIHYNIFIAGGTYIPLQTIFYVVWILSIVIFFITQINTLKRSSLNKLFFILVLLFFPLIGIIGTDNLPHVQLTFYLTPWLILFFIVFFRYGETFFYKMAIALLLIFSTIQSFNAVYNTPYLLNDSLAIQKEKLTINKNEFVYVDKQFKEEVMAIKSLLIKNGFKKGDYIFTYSEMVGLGYLLSANFPTNNTCWFRSNDDESNIKILENFFQVDQPTNIFFLVDERSPYSFKLKSFFKSKGYNIDEDYSKSKSLNVHFNKEDYNISIFAPKKNKL